MRCMRLRIGLSVTAPLTKSTRTFFQKRYAFLGAGERSAGVLIQSYDIFLQLLQGRSSSHYISSSPRTLVTYSDLHFPTRLTGKDRSRPVSCTLLFTSRWFVTHGRHFSSGSSYYRLRVVGIFSSKYERSRCARGTDMIYALSLAFKFSVGFNSLKVWGFLNKPGLIGP